MRRAAPPTSLAPGVEPMRASRPTPRECEQLCTQLVASAMQDAVVAERALLGGLLLCPETIALVDGFLEAEHFYSAAHSLIFGAVLKLHHGGWPVDTITVRETLAAEGSLDAAGGDDTLLHLTDVIPYPAHLRAYALIVQDRAVRRQLAAACVDLLSRASGPERTDELLRAAELSIAKLRPLLAQAALDPNPAPRSTTQAPTPPPPFAAADAASLSSKLISSSRSLPPERRSP
jgi:hypothetical protein